MDPTTPIPSLAVVIPVYNSQDSLDELLERLAAVLPGLAQQFEVILVNDDSRDASWQVIQRLAGRYAWVRGVKLMRNYGQHNALLCGIRLAQGQIIVTMDDDLQHPPEEIHKLLAGFAQGYDVVYGVPAALPHSWWRNLFSAFTKRMLASVMGVKSMRQVSAFRAFDARLRKAFERYENPNVLIDVLLSWSTTRFGHVSVHEAPRTQGRSNYNFFKLMQYGLLILTGFNTAPLRFTSMIGFIFTFIGLAIFLYVLAIYFLVGSIPGFPFLASIISIFSGTQLFALGIIGEYLARVFDRSMDRPAYVIDAATPSEPGAHAEAAQAIHADHRQPG